MKLKMFIFYPVFVYILTLFSCSQYKENEVQLNMAHKLYGEGDIKKTEYICRRIIKSDRNNTTAIFLLAKSLFYAGNKKESLSILEKLYKKAPGYFDAKLFYITVLIDLEELDKAEIILQKELLCNSKDYRLYHLHYVLSSKKSDLKKMIEYEKKAAFCLNDSYKIYMELSMIYTNLGMIDIANEYMAKGKMFCIEK